jgi:LuxR family maltose regulon positive regulatory protein
VVVQCARAALLVWRGELTAAAAVLDEALVGARRGRLTLCELDALSQRALVGALRGELKLAARCAHAAEDLADVRREGGFRPPQLVPALIALAFCSFEWDDVQGGYHHSRAARDLADAGGDRLAANAADVVSAWGGSVRGPADPIGAARVVEAPITPLLEALLAVLTSRCALAEGDPGRALAALRTGTIGEAELLVGRARLELAQDALDAAARALAPVLDGSAHAILGRTTIEACVLRALLASRSGSAGESRLWLERALDLAEPEGARGPFLDAGPEIAELLRGLVRSGTAHRWLVGTLLAALSGRADHGRAEPHELVEPLSAKEEIVLRYLPTLMSNQEIAAELFVSVNTVKTHLKSIYRKLGAAHRRDAVRRARELRLIA